VDSIPHEVLTLVGGRVARLYHEDGAVVRIARLSGTMDEGAMDSPV